MTVCVCMCIFTYRWCYKVLNLTIDGSRVQLHKSHGSVSSTYPLRWYGWQEKQLLAASTWAGWNGLEGNTADAITCYEIFYMLIDKWHRSDFMTVIIFRGPNAEFDCNVYVARLGVCISNAKRTCGLWVEIQCCSIVNRGRMGAV